MLLLEWHIWAGFAIGSHDLFMWRLTLGWVSIFVDRVPATNTLRSIRRQLLAAQRELTTRSKVPGSSRDRD